MVAKLACSPMIPQGSQRIARGNEPQRDCCVAAQRPWGDVPNQTSTLKGSHICSTPSGLVFLRCYFAGALPLPFLSIPFGDFPLTEPANLVLSTASAAPLSPIESPPVS